MEDFILDEFLVRLPEIDKNTNNVQNINYYGLTSDTNSCNITPSNEAGGWSYAELTFPSLCPDDTAKLPLPHVIDVASYGSHDISGSLASSNIIFYSFSNDPQAGEQVSMEDAHTKRETKASVAYFAQKEKHDRYKKQNKKASKKHRQKKKTRQKNVEELIKDLETENELLMTQLAQCLSLRDGFQGLLDGTETHTKSINLSK